MFDLEKYQRNLDTRWLGQTITYFEELDSTNSYLKNCEDINHGRLCLTDYQIKGRGQYKRKWESAGDKNLTFTLAFQPTKTDRFHILTLACARALVEQIEDDIDCTASIKWPNDVLVNGLKTAGLLTETVFNGNKIDRLLLGIGINVNQQKFGEGISDKAGSIMKAAGKKVDREVFLSKLLSRFEFEYTRWHKQNNDLLKWINKKIIGHGKWVQLSVNGEQSEDKFKLLGVDQNGKLAVIDEDGSIKTFSHEQVRIITD